MNNTRKFTMIYDDVLADKRINATQVIIYSKLCTLASISENGVLKVSNEYLAGALSVHENTISNGIKKLKEHDFITIETTRKRKTNGMFKTERLITINDYVKKETNRKHTDETYKQLINTINVVFDKDYNAFTEQQLEVIDTLSYEDAISVVFGATKSTFYNTDICKDKRIMFRSVEEVNNIKKGSN